jgi:hypothetical protein
MWQVQVLGGYGRGPKIEWNVRPEDAHKQDPSNLWLTSAAVDEQQNFSAGFIIPARDNPLRLVDLIEVERQAGIVFAHHHFSLPGDTVFVLTAISLDAVSADDWQGSGRLSGRVKVSAADPPATQPIRHARIRFSLEMRRGSLAWGTAAVSFLTPGLHARLRRRAIEGQPRLKDGAPLEEMGAGIVPTDLMDPLVGDHSSDHVSGMAVAVGIERTLTARSGETLRGLSLRFHEYVEHLSPLLLSVDDRRHGQVVGRVHQRGVTKAEFSGVLA